MSDIKNFFLSENNPMLFNQAIWKKIVFCIFILLVTISAIYFLTTETIGIDLFLRLLILTILLGFIVFLIASQKKTRNNCIYKISHTFSIWSLLGLLLFFVSAVWSGSGLFTAIGNESALLDPFFAKPIEATLVVKDDNSINSLQNEQQIGVEHLVFIGLAVLGLSISLVLSFFSFEIAQKGLKSKGLLAKFRIFIPVGMFLLWFMISPALNLFMLASSPAFIEEMKAQYGLLIEQYYVINDRISAYNGLPKQMEGVTSTIDAAIEEQFSEQHGSGCGRVCSSLRNLKNDFESAGQLEISAIGIQLDQLVNGGEGKQAKNQSILKIVENIGELMDPPVAPASNNRNQKPVDPLDEKVRIYRENSKALIIGLQKLERAERDIPRIFKQLKNVLTKHEQIFAKLDEEYEAAYKQGTIKETDLAAKNNALLYFDTLQDIILNLEALILQGKLDNDAEEEMQSVKNDSTPIRQLISVFRFPASVELWTIIKHWDAYFSRFFIAITIDLVALFVSFIIPAFFVKNRSEGEVL